MNDYLLIDVEDGSIPLTRVVAEDSTEALCKAIKGMLKDEYMTFEEVCECLGIELREVTNISTYE